MNKKKFNRELLEKILTRDSAILDDTKELPNSLNQNCRISFICHCGTSDTKNFRMMIENSGAYCKSCTKLNRLNKVKATNIERRGVEHPFQCTEVKEKIISTNLERYGAENPMQNAEVRERAKETNREKYGTPYAMQNAEVRERAKETNREKYGTPYPSQCAEIMDKVRATNIERYGANCSLQNDEVREKAKKTNREKRGVDNPFQCTEVKEKIILTNLERYGAENPMQNDEVKEKIILTNLEKYGTPHAMQNDEVKEKTKLTNLEKYGTPYAMQNAEILERAQKSAYKRKDYTTPGGQVWSLQGYEHFAAPKLIDEYGEDDIISDIKEVPQIKWVDLNGIERKYHCDFYVKSHKVIIEVKSTWTESKDIEKIAATREHANALGYGYRLIVIDKQGIWIRDELSPSILGAEGGESANIRLA